jgi:hypothetical protein
VKTDIRFLLISRSFLLRMRNVADKIFREKQNTHFASVNFFFSENRAVHEIMWTNRAVHEIMWTNRAVHEIMWTNRAVHEIMWTNIVKPDRPQTATWRMRLACWMTKVTNPLRICNTYCSSTATMVAMDESQCYVIRILLVMFLMSL